MEKVMERTKVFQRGKLIGTLPDMHPRSKHGIFDIRPNDFTPRRENGELVLEASRTICPGDFECLEGWRWYDGRSNDTAVAEMFDALAKVIGPRP